eukprot:gnl/MRDRNA2_/MRDRNA2_126381_c0_seq1.p1 gnl/MRDRNA2_/MRDRNA2_126381_c0~~gnl/MRDRNA2_/MRDRNA2_126381_c0_seq1.p1  ORF type:complete len:504 (+),score=57.63 gnl/MRDRNA2_/MRDRNA2_126381_c0_seq1:83-1594(+)
MLRFAKLLAVACIPLLITAGEVGQESDADGYCVSLDHHGSSHGSSHDAKSSKYHESTTLTVTLFGFFGLIVLGFYIVNSSAGDFRMKRILWRLVEQTVGIFIAVLSFVNIEIEMHHAHWSHGNEMYAMLGMLVFWTIVIFGLAFCRKDHISDLMTICHLGGHTLGFAGYFFIGHLQETYGRESLGRWILCWAVGTLIQVAICSPFALLELPYLGAKLGAEGHGHAMEEYFEEAHDVLHESIAFASSGNFIRCIMIGISGCPPHLKEAIGSHPLHERFLLLAIGIFFGMISPTVHMILQKKKKPEQESDQELEDIQLEEEDEDETYYCGLGKGFVKEFTKMSCAWSVIFYGRWEFYESAFKDALLGRMVFALTSSFCGLLLVYLSVIALEHCGELNSAAEKHLKHLSKVIGVVIGFSWEQTFDVAIETTGAVTSWGRWLFIIGLIVYTLPAYYLYIMPRVIRKEEVLRRYLAEVQRELSSIITAGLPAQQKDLDDGTEDECQFG